MPAHEIAGCTNAMKTSLLNRLQSPLPTAENTPQTATVATPELPSGFAGLFQKAIGWLSPKTATPEGVFNGNNTKVIDLQINENQPLVTVGIAVDTNHISSNSTSIAGENNGVSKGVLGSIDLLNVENVRQQTNSVLIANIGNAEPSITVPNLQTTEIVFSNGEAQAADLSSQIDYSFSDQILPTGSQEPNKTNISSIQNLNTESVLADSLNEQIENNTSQLPIVDAPPQISLEDVVTSVYAAVQTNLPAENVEISYHPFGKNSAEITLSLKNSSSQNGIPVGEQNPDSLHLLETLSQHIDTIQKTVGKSATVKFGITAPQFTEEQLPSVDSIGEVLNDTAVAFENPSKTTQNDIGRTATKSDNQSVELAGTIKQGNDFVTDSVQVSDENNSDENTEKTMTGTVEHQEVLKDNTVSQDANAMIVAALLSNAVQPKIESQPLQTQEDSEADVSNENSEKTTYQAEKHPSKRGKTMDVPLGITTLTVDTDAVSISENSDIPFENGKQSPLVNAKTGTKNTAPIDTKVLNGISLDSSHDSTLKSEVVNEKGAKSQTTTTEYTTSDYSNGTQQEKVDGNPPTNGKQETSAQSNVVQPQVNISSENIQLESSDTQENIGMSLPIKGNNSSKTVQKENTAQPVSILETPKSEPITDLQKTNVLSNQKTIDSTIVPKITEENSKTDENSQTTEIQKQSFNSVRELLDASAKNGITVSGLIIRVDTPEIEVPLSIVPPVVNKQIDSKNKDLELDASKSVPTISVQNVDAIEPEIPMQTAGKQPIETKQPITTKAVNLQVMSPIVHEEQDIVPLIVQSNTIQAVVSEPAAVKLNTPKAEVSIPIEVKTDAPHIELPMQNSIKTDTPNVQALQSNTDEAEPQNAGQIAIKTVAAPMVNPKIEVPNQVRTGLDSFQTEAPKPVTQTKEPITVKKGVSQNELPKQSPMKLDAPNAQVSQHVELKSDNQLTEQSKPISPTVGVLKVDPDSKTERSSTSAPIEQPKPNTLATGAPKVIQANSVQQQSLQVEHAEMSVSEPDVITSEPLQSVGVKVDTTEKEAVKSNTLKNEAPVTEESKLIVDKSDTPKTDGKKVESATSNTPKAEATASNMFKAEVSNTASASNPKIEAMKENDTGTDVPQAKKINEEEVLNDANHKIVKPELTVKKEVKQPNSHKEEVVYTPRIETSETPKNKTAEASASKPLIQQIESSETPKSKVEEANVPKSSMPQDEVIQSVSKNETAGNTEKVEPPKAEKSKPDSIKSEVTEREIHPTKAQQLQSEQTSTTIQSSDVSAIAAVQKSTVAGKTEHKAEKRTAKTDIVDSTATTIVGEQLPKQITERNPMNQNEQQKQDNKQQPTLHKKNFETAIAQEVQQSETVESKVENISNADSIRAKASVESNAPSQVTNTTLFQPVVAPIKNYQGVDSAKKSIPRVDVDSFAPATAQLVRTMPQQTGGSVRMQLAPDALGAVTVQVNVRDKNAALRIDVETTAAKQALEAQIPMLREQMAQQGITTERIEIQVRPREDFSMFSGFNQQNSSARQEEQQARQSYLRSFGDGQEDREDNSVLQEVLPKVKDKKPIIQNRVEFYA